MKNKKTIHKPKSIFNIKLVIMALFLLIVIGIVMASQNPHTVTTSTPDPAHSGQGLYGNEYMSDRAGPTLDEVSSSNEEVSKGDAGPFWKNTEEVQVCKVPYYVSSNCTKLKVTLNYNNTARILNSDYVLTHNITCYHATTTGDVSQRVKYVFCRSWDDSNQQWDFLPTWVSLD